MSKDKGKGKDKGQEKKKKKETKKVVQRVNYDPFNFNVENFYGNLDCHRNILIV